MLGASLVTAAWRVRLPPDVEGGIFYIRQEVETRWEYNGTVHQLKKAYESVRREALYSIVIDFGIPRKLVGLIKMCLNETYSRVRIGQTFSLLFRMA
jgi:hypothetical protein